MCPAQQSESRRRQLNTRRRQQQTLNSTFGTFHPLFHQRRGGPTRREPRTDIRQLHPCCVPALFVTSYAIKRRALVYCCCPTPHDLSKHFSLPMRTAFLSCEYLIDRLPRASFPRPFSLGISCNALCHFHAAQPRAKALGGETRLCCLPTLRVGVAAQRERGRRLLPVLAHRHHQYLSSTSPSPSKHQHPSRL